MGGSGARRPYVPCVEFGNLLLLLLLLLLLQWRTGVVLGLPRLGLRLVRQNPAGPRERRDEQLAVLPGQPRGLRSTCKPWSNERYCRRA